ncbi:uncharacterized protein I303_107808 [Kwoniella dejecticola CBS 10117]|uniref:CMGC/CLK protein kinase n=1 Tax=Kwoniella dejecticola CBS 10117 TaxID=1296121 RepID=A0A1A5ZVR5_9TREE|nr:CMGC/CLK protein kinase [Kwoniella dejecticola CBS 10117]OBR81901.1 CMGC/CLK protein kinase [Kwoniella dejecticola CBS 10117]
MSRHHQQHLSSPSIYHHHNHNHNPSNSTGTTYNNAIDNHPSYPPTHIQAILSPPTPTESHYSDTEQYPSVLPPRPPSLFQPPPPREDKGYRLESRGRIPAIRIPPVPYRRNSGQSQIHSAGEPSSSSSIQIHRRDSNPAAGPSPHSPYEQPLLPSISTSTSITTSTSTSVTSLAPEQNNTSKYHLRSLGLTHNQSYSHSQPSPVAHSSHSRSPYAGGYYNLSLSNPLSAGSSSANTTWYSEERGLRSPHPPLTATSQHSHLWPHPYITLHPPYASSPYPNTHTHTHTHSLSQSHSRSPQRRESIGSSGRGNYQYLTSNSDYEYSHSHPSVPGPSSQPVTQNQPKSQQPLAPKYPESPFQNYEPTSSYLPPLIQHQSHSHSGYSSSDIRQTSPLHIPPPLKFRYSVSPPPTDSNSNIITMPPRKKATGDTSLLGSSTPRTMSSATGLTGSVSLTRSGRNGANGKGWTTEHTYDSVGQKKEVIVIDDSQSPMIQQPIRKRTRAQAAAEQAQAYAAAQAHAGNNIYNGQINGHSTTSLNSSTTKKRKVDEGSEHGSSSAKKAKGKLASTATSASVQATGQYKQHHLPPSKIIQTEAKAPPVATGPPGHSSGQPAWDDAEGHYIVKPDDVIGGRYKIVRLLGQGTFGKVVEARHIETRRKVAIKVIRAVQKYRDASKIEIRVLETLKKHDPKNDNKCIHLDECFDFRNHPCLVSELYGMSVFDFLKQNNFQPFPERHIQDFAKSLLRSVAFLHTLKLVHTDLKPENILLCSNESRLQGARAKNAKSKSILRNTEIRLIDFGSATFESEYHSSVVSTRHYRAPEIILGLPWSYPCDMFSIGCILVEFYTGDALFQTHDNLEHLAMMEVVMGKFSHRMTEKGRHKKPEFFRGNKIDFPNATVSKASKKYVKGMRSLKDIIAPTTKHQQLFLDLCVRLLEHDPDVRIKVHDALRHPYLNEPIPDPL